MMVVEIVGGTIYGSMAVVADGWHMSTHAAALGIAAPACRFARSHAHDRRFACGTGKLGELGGFSSALILAMIALMIAYQSADRLMNPVAIGFNQALPIAAIGLAVNLVRAWVLGDDRAHHHDHDRHPSLEHGLKPHRRRDSKRSSRRTFPMTSE